MTGWAELGGLPEHTVAEISTVLQRFPEIRWVKLYGSRALGRHRPGSDIDLAYSSPQDFTAALAGALEDLPMPYRVDVTHWESLQHEGLRRHIAAVGVPWPAGQSEADPEAEITAEHPAGCRRKSPGGTAGIGQQIHPCSDGGEALKPPTHHQPGSE